MSRYVVAMALSLVCVFAGDVTTGDTLTWDGSEGDDNWHTGRNWDGGRVPGRGDTAIIPTCQGCAYTVKIKDSNAECQILELAGGNLLEIRGRTLTLGEDDTQTESTLSGTIRLKHNGSLNGELAVRDWVVLGGSGQIVSSYVQFTPNRGIIKRATDGIGIKVQDSVAIMGHIQFLCSVVYDSTGQFGAYGAGDVMRFGSSSGALAPDIQISTNLSPQSRPVIFSGDSTTVEWYAVTFAQAAPNWRVVKGGTHKVIGSAPSEEGYYVDVPFDLYADKGGTFRFQHDFSCTGTLTLDSEQGNTTEVVTSAGKLVKFYTP